MSNLQIDNNHKRYKEILNQLNKGHISHDNYDSTQKPFFCIDKSKPFMVDFQKIEGLPEGLNRNIITIYNIIGNPKCEIYLNHWTIMSCEKAIQQYNNYCKDGITNIFDIAFQYRGMGHIQVLSCDLKTHLLFYRPDGGSSGIERELNYNKLKSEGVDEYPQFYFSRWFYSIYK